MNLSKIISTAAAIVFSAVFIFALPSCNAEFNESEKSQSTELKISKELCLEHTFFLGDSNTAHLSHEKYFAISGMVSSDRIWTGKGNTLTLDADINVQDPKTGAIKSISELAKSEQPEYLVITLGFNGFSNPVSEKARDSLNKLFISAYRKLITDIKASSPETVILIQSIFPVKEGNSVANPDIINARIDELNGLLKELANAEKIKYLNTQSVLKDPYTNCLKDEYTSSGSFYHTDGYHLSDTGLLAVLNYIKENAYE